MNDIPTPEQIREMFPEKKPTVFNYETARQLMLDVAEVLRVFKTFAKIGAADIRKAYGSIDILEEFTELMQAKEDGRLVVLPCKIGDTVYCSDGGAWEVCHIELFGDCIIFRLRGNLHGSCTETSDRLTKTWWLTREEAYAALAKRK